MPKGFGRMLKLVLGFLMYAYGEADRVCCSMKQLTESEKFWRKRKYAALCRRSPVNRKVLVRGVGILLWSFKIGPIGARW
jgi:hypothetical protein